MHERPVQDQPAATSTIDWGHLIFLAVIGAAVAWYLYDTISVSTDINNVLVVVPLCVLALILCVVILPQCVRREGRVVKRKSGGIAEMGASEIRSSNRKHLLSIGGLAVALGAYVFLLDAIGFDIATWLFALAAMLICGERRPLPLALYPLVTAIVLITAFRALLPYPMYTAIL